MTIWRTRIACWMPTATERHSEYVTLVAFSLQQWLRERSPLLRWSFIACLVRDFRLPPRRLLTPEYETNMLSRNVGKKLPLLGCVITQTSSVRIGLACLKCHMSCVLWMAYMYALKQLIYDESLFS
jgi:hypothetical protein